MFRGYKTSFISLKHLHKTIKTVKLNQTMFYNVLKWQNAPKETKYSKEIENIVFIKRSKTSLFVWFKLKSIHLSSPPPPDSACTPAWAPRCSCESLWCYRCRYPAEFPSSKSGKYTNPRDQKHTQCCLFFYFGLTVPGALTTGCLVMSTRSLIL